MSVKDQNLEEKEQLVINGTIFADEYRDRKTGEKLDTSHDSQNCAKIHEFNEGTVLTDAILEEVKSGDIVHVLQMEFVVNNKVNQSPRSITGKMVSAITDHSISVIELDWVKGQELTPQLKTFDGGQVSKLYRHSVAGLSILSTKSAKFTKLSDFWGDSQTISVKRNGISVLNLDGSGNIEAGLDFDVYIYSISSNQVESITLSVDSSNVEDVVSQL